MVSQSSMMSPEHRDLPDSGWLFFTDTPPLRGPAPGSHGLACHFLDACGGLFESVLTRRTRRYVVPHSVQSQFPIPIYFLSDATPFGVRRFLPGIADLVDLVCGVASMVWLRHHLQPTKRTLALLGANGWSLVLVALLRVITRTPLDIYLVDDLEASARIQQRPILRRILPWLEKQVLQNAARVFTISPGYADHLRLKYGVPAQWLPAPIHLDRVQFQPFHVPADGFRTLLFVGGVSQLYLSALIDLLEELVAWNRIHPDRPIRLEVVSYGFPVALAERRDLSDVLQIRVGLSPEDFADRCRNAWAFFLPYAFDPEVRTMVCTSFSWKLSDAYRSGRPILVYGPAEASVSRYFREAQLPLCATARAELKTQLEAIETLDGPALAQCYHDCWAQFHSSAAVRQRLLGAAPTKSDGSLRG